MKKLISLMLCLCMLLTCMCTTAMATETAPAADAAAVAGKWTAVSGEADGMTLDKDMLAAFGMSVEIMLKADGTASLIMEGEEEGGIAWTADAAGVTLTVEGDSLVLPFNENGGLTWDLGGGTLLHFEKAIVGKWIATSAETEGMTMDQAMLAEFGMTVELVVNEDGTASLAMGGEVEEGLTWTSDAAGIILTMDGDSLAVTFNDKGGLTMDFGGTYLFLEMEGTENGASAGDPVAAEGAEAFVGSWNATTMDMGGVVLNYADLGGTMQLTINADGTASMFDGESTDEAVWTFADGELDIDGMKLTLTEDGQLCMAEEGAAMYFERMDGSAPAAPVDEPVDLTTSPILGVWNDGKEITFTINADGTCVSTDQWGDSNMEWTIQDGVPMITTGFWYGAPMILNDDDTLYVSDGWAVDTTFTRGELVVAEAPAVTADAVVGEWADESRKLVLNADGTGVYTFPNGDTANGTWAINESGCVLNGFWLSQYNAIPEADGTLTVTDGGFNIYKLTREGAAAPAAAADTSALIGTWFDGERVNFTINADGTCVATDQYGDSNMEWAVVDGAAKITSGMWSGAPLVLNEDGTLYVNDGWFTEKTFTFGAGEIKVGSDLATSAVTVAASSADQFVGKWTGVSMDTESGSFPLADFGMTMDLTINADGSLILYDGVAEDAASWTFVDGALSAADGMVAIKMLEDGGLVMEQEFQILYLVRADGSASAPVDIPAAPGGAETPADLSSSPAIGVWNDGEGTTFTVNADGTCVATDEWGDNNMEWTIVDGVAKITSGMWSDAPMVPQADGTLYVNDGFFIDKYLMPGAYEKPVVDLTGNPVIGVWNDGNGTTFTVNADGSCVATDVWGDNTMEWNVVDGVPTITSGLWSGAPMVLNADGTLYVNDGWVIDATFVPGAAESQAPAGAAGTVAGTAEDFVGVWNASVMDLGGMTMNAADLGMVMDLTINADGTITMFDGESTETGTWTLVDGKVDVMGEMTLEMTEDGRMAMAEDGATMFFVRAEGGASEPTAPAAEVVAVPGEMEDFAGLWFGKSMEMEGMTMALSDIGMIMEIRMAADGTITLFDGEATETGVWTLVDGKADIDGMICTLMSDGTMVAEDPEGAKVIFTGFIGEWKACYMSTGGLTGDLRFMGITSTLILNADGTGSVDFPAAEEGIWYIEEGILRFGEAGMPIELLSGGFLKFGSDMAGYVVYSQDETAVWDPNAAPAATAVPEPIVDPTAIPTQGSAGGEIDMQARLNKKYVAKTYTAYGQTMDASMLGAEYSVLFRENGTCDFGIAGMVVPNLPWGLQKVAVGLTEMDAFVINYYGTMFNVVPTAEGFDMDYYGTMTLHLVAAE